MPNKKILLVDDDYDLRYLLKKKLISEGLECYEVSHPENAIPKAEDVQPQLILLDLNLPQMSGFGLLRAIKQKETLSHIPVVVLSVYDDEEIKQESLNLGAALYVTKAEMNDSLMHKIEGFLN